MSLNERLEKAKQKKLSIRPDNDPDLCRLQALWVQEHGSEDGFAPIYQQFRHDLDGTLADYIKRYLPSAEA